ncbi:enoyl-CoA hydratase-related protein [Neisseriaceae bacterium TC5R-5]|nr:enoyl-CoA hydratase-related protein [Neisseriaceae bacterium TC5R-5]
MSENAVLLTIDQRGIAEITLNRSELHNALDDQHIRLLTSKLESVAQDSKVKAVILSANGISFSTGHDSEWMRRMVEFNREELQRDAGLLTRLLHVLDTLPKPTIAKVQGSAFGIGVGLVACCDVAIASSAALFSFSEVRLGMIPAQIAPYIIRAMGERPARRYFISAERLNAGKAKRLGLIHQVVESDELDASTEQLIKHLLINSPAAMVAAKQLIAEIGARGVNTAVSEHCIERIVDIRLSAEGQEGIRAMIEQRKPGWMA